MEKVLNAFKAVVVWCMVWRSVAART